MLDPRQALAPFGGAFAILALSLVLAGCAGNPAVPVPSVPVPAAWHAKGSPSAPRENATAVWWRQAGSAELSTLIEAALKNNRDLHAAAARVAQARAIVGEVDSERQLQLGGTAGVARGRTTVLDPRSTRLQAGLQASWEADLFGAKGLAHQAAVLDSERAELVRQGMETVIAAEVATAWFDAAILDERRQLCEKRIDALDRAMRVAMRQFAAGRLSRPEWVARELQKKNAEVEHTQLEAAFNQRLNQLSVLIGRPAGELKPDFATLAALRLPAPAATLPGELLERRPDVQQHLREVSAEAARVGISQRALYPRLIFSWDSSLERTRVDALGSTRGVALGYGISLTLPILDGGRIRAQIKVSEARLEEAMAGYEKAMLEALADAETVLVRAQSAASAGVLSDASLRLAGEQHRQVKRLFVAGQADQGRVIDAELALLQAEDTRLQAQGASLCANVDVLRAFSGPLEVSIDREPLNAP